MKLADHLATVLDTDHPETHGVVVPISLLRIIERDLRTGYAAAAQLGAANFVGDIGGTLAR